MAPRVEFGCLGEVPISLCVTAEHRLQAAAVIGHRASGSRPDEENLVVERGEEFEEPSSRCLGVKFGSDVGV
jgi:hypothetical protein